MIRDRMSQLINHVPDVTITIRSDDDGKRYFRITGTGYDIPYSFKGWFYARRCFYERPSGGIQVKEEWIETITCGMKRHRHSSKQRRA